MAKKLGEMAFNRGAINWFPGHMAAATRAIKERLKLADLVLEVRDARPSILDATTKGFKYTMDLHKVSYVCPEPTKSAGTTQTEEVQAALADVVVRENELKEQIKEVKSWTQVVNEPSLKRTVIIEKHLKKQIQEEKDKQEKAVNIIIKGLKEYKC